MKQSRSKRSTTNKKQRSHGTSLFFQARENETKPKPTGHLPHSKHRGTSLLDSLSLSLYVCVYLLSTYLPIYLSIYVPIYLSMSIYTYIYTYMYQTTNLPIYPSLYLSISLSLSLFYSLSLSLSRFLSLSLSLSGFVAQPSLTLPPSLFMYLCFSSPVSLYVSVSFLLPVLFLNFLYLRRGILCAIW